MKTISLFISITLLLVTKLAAQKPLINGEFTCSKTTALAAGQVFNSTTASVVFVAKADTSINPLYGIEAGNVKINNTTLPLFNKMFYGDTSNTLDFMQQHWFISGNSSIPAMDFLITQPFPDFVTGTGTTNTRVINNDTLYKKDTLVVYLNNVKNADSLIVSIIDGYGIDSTAKNGQIGNNGRVFLDFVFSARGTELYILPTHLQTLHAGPKAVVSITGANYTIQTIQGKNFKFKNTYSLMEANLYIKE